MSLGEDLQKEVAQIYADGWDERDGERVPEAEDLGLGNEGINLDAAVMYADLADSTGLVTNYKYWFAAEVIKAFLHCAAKIIRDCGGTITAYDGDRVMAVWIGDNKCTATAEAALKLSWAISNIVEAKAKARYDKLPSDFAVKYAVGIDTGKLFIARTGVRGANDLVWIGRAANISAKMSGIRDGSIRTFITSDVYSRLADGSKLDGDGNDMWRQFWWEAGKLTLYRTTYWWSLE